uniref:Uncharacterized protein n=1 Tax=Magallana gigas TaxID=29159 RepID=A0A8W8M6X6_MAGGI
MSLDTFHYPVVPLPTIAGQGRLVKVDELIPSQRVNAQLLGKDHPRKQQCKNERVCGGCQKNGQALGQTECKHYVDPPTTGKW